MSGFAAPGYAWGMSENIGEQPGDDTSENETYNSYSVDDEDQPQGDGDSLVERPRADRAARRGLLPAGAVVAPARATATPPPRRRPARRSTSGSRRRSPSRTPTLQAAEETEDVGGEVGYRRAGRLVDEDEGLGPDEEKDLVGEDVGIDGAGASAEEAAVHVVEDDLDEFED